MAMHTLLVTRRLCLAHRDLHAENKRGGSSIQQVKQSSSTQKISCIYSAAVVDAMRDGLKRDTTGRGSVTVSHGSLARVQHAFLGNLDSTDTCRKALRQTKSKD
jgi:hypothetical protein